MKDKYGARYKVQEGISRDVMKLYLICRASSASLGWPGEAFGEYPFGPLFLGDPELEHEKDKGVPIAQLFKAEEIYAQVLYRLTGSD